MPTRTHCTIAIAAMAISALAMTATAAPERSFDDVAKGFTKVETTTDGSFYDVWYDKKSEELLAELPRGFERQKHYIAVTPSAGGAFAGLQGPDFYVYWKRFDDRLALITPELQTRSTGEAESRDSVERLFTDRVLFDVPIVTTGPSGQPVIDLDAMLLGEIAPMASRGRGFGRGGGGRLNTRLAEIATCKTFPKNLEIDVRVPGNDGRFVGYHFSISKMEGSRGYKPREADERIGYFTTVYRDLGKYKNDEKWVRYINRWHLEKRDSSLRVSPPKEPIVFYIEHTVPVRYRRFVRDGVLEWNKAFEQVGLDGAIEVRQQDKATGAYMDIDPEDVRYNFVRWLNNDISTAIGPSRAHPETGQILDADIVLTDGWIRAYWGWYHEQAPELAVESLTTETLSWLEDYPDWDPRLLLASPERKERILAMRADRNRRIAAGEDVDQPFDTTVLLDEDMAALASWVGPQDRLCMAAHGLAFSMAFSSLCLEMMDMMPEVAAEGDVLDGIPEWFIGPMVKELVCHEVGHTLGLRHNFKASSIYSLEEINSDEIKGRKPFGGSVMDYLPPNFNVESGEIQGDFAMIGIGPYDMWAIEYGYTFDDTKDVLARVSEPALVYLTDDDTGGPDPLARTYDLSSEPLEYAENQIRLITRQREKILSDFVEDGESWSKARRGYQITLSMHTRVVSMMANWIGGADVSRARKGDPGAGPPVEVIDPVRQRAALDFVIEQTFRDEAFGLDEELVAHMTVDKWTDRSPGDRSDPTWPVHDVVSSVQASALTMLMNPTTIRRVYDNEFRTPAGEDALTLPEMFDTVVNAAFGELDIELDGETWTERDPMISSLRRNLQAGLVDRLIVFADGDNGLPRAIRTLARSHVRDLNQRVGRMLLQAEEGQVDRYTTAHLEDLRERMNQSMNTIRVTG